jgi:hypothetical protein
MWCVQVDLSSCKSNGEILVAYIGGGVPGAMIRFTSAGRLDT